MRLACASLLALTLGCAASHAADAPQPMTRQARSCAAWQKHLEGLLRWSEHLRIHTVELRSVVRAESHTLRARCLRDISQASLARYVLLSKLLFDDEADEFESFD